MQDGSCYFLSMTNSTHGVTMVWYLFLGCIHVEHNVLCLRTMSKGGDVDNARVAIAKGNS